MHLTQIIRAKTVLYLIIVLLSYSISVSEGFSRQRVALLVIGELRGFEQHAVLNEYYTTIIAELNSTQGYDVDIFLCSDAGTFSSTTDFQRSSIFDFFMSKGMSRERLHLFFETFDMLQKETNPQPNYAGVQLRGKAALLRTEYCFHRAIAALRPNKSATGDQRLEEFAWFVKLRPDTRLLSPLPKLEGTVSMFLYMD